jgi:hypothetical protein
MLAHTISANIRVLLKTKILNKAARVKNAASKPQILAIAATNRRIVQRGIMEKTSVSMLLINNISEQIKSRKNVTSMPQILAIVATNTRILPIGIMGKTMSCEI